MVLKKVKHQFQLEVKADDNVHFRLDDYQERVVIMGSQIQFSFYPEWSSIIGWGVDAITGSIKELILNMLKLLPRKIRKPLSLISYREWKYP